MNREGEMDMDRPCQRDALDNARAAFKHGDYPEALRQYDYFFDHALDDDPAALYGVRLSYCLDEWAKLGEKYPPALESLIEKKNSARALLEQSRDPERFHDFVAISKNLNGGDEPIRQFLEYHVSDPELARSIIRFIWDRLITAKQWEVCGAYLTDPIEKYEAEVEKFDGILAMWKADPTWAVEEFDVYLRGKIARNVSNLILVLRENGRMGEATILEERIAADAEARGQNAIIALVQERITMGA
jgi:FMN phosphatase YigB (HAD superfamily)